MYAAPEHGHLPPQPHHGSTFVHTLFSQPMQQLPYNHPLYPHFQPESPAVSSAPFLSVPPPHNPIAAAAAAAAAANASFARVQHRPFHEVKRRRRLTPEETRRLTYVFLHHTTKPDAALRQRLAEELGMTARAVQVWFQNRRAKVKREQETLDKDLEESSLTAQQMLSSQIMQELGVQEHSPHEVYEQSLTSQHEQAAQQPLAQAQAIKEEELQAIESMLNLDHMMDDDGFLKEDSASSEHGSSLDLSLAADIIKQDLTTQEHPRNVYNLSIHTGMRDNPVLVDTTLTTGLREVEELRRNGLGISELTSPDTISYGSEYGDAFGLYGHGKSSLSSSPLSHTVSTIGEDPSLASMAEMMSNALSELVIPFPGSPFSPSVHDSFTASPCTHPLTPGHELDMLDLLQLPTPVNAQHMTPLSRPGVARLTTRSNSCNNYYPYSPAIPSPMSKTAQQRYENRQSRSVANSPYHCSPSRELVWMSNVTPKEIEQARHPKAETPVPQDVRRIQQQATARRYSWSVGSQH